MRAIILAAGRGSRMKGMTDERPKCLVSLRGQSLLAWQLQAIRGAGIQEIAIVTGYRREMLAGFGLREFFNENWAVTNMVSSLACAADWLGTGPCLVSYSDIFYSAEGIGPLLASEASLAVAYDPDWLEQWQRRFADPLDDAESFRLNPDSTLAEIGNKPHSVAEIQGQYMGLLRFEPEGWAEIDRIRQSLPKEQRDRMHMTGSLQLVIAAQNLAVKAVPYKGEWGEIDSAEDLAVYQAGF